MRSSGFIVACAALLAFVPRASGAQEKHDSVKVDPKAKVVPHDRTVFGPDPNFGDAKYDYQAQLDIYGAKHMNPTQRPLLELGREMYQNGTFDKGINLLGSHNPFFPQLLVYGDVRSAAGTNSGLVVDKQVSRWANRINLDVDLRLTASERIHALFRPIEKKGKFTGGENLGDSLVFKGNFDGEPVALFFEGDAGAILGGLTGRDAPFDMPIAGGLMPLLFHNGVWLEDAFIGGAFTIPANNSATLGWTNFDITFFYGAKKVSNTVVGTGGDAGQIFGTNTFIEANHGYWEFGYAFVNGAKDLGRDFHSVGASFTRRYGGRISNSIRYIGSYGGTTDAKGATATTGGNANGHLFLLENSLITSKPSTVVPYLNLFYGIDSPVSAARDPGAGGILKNTGLNFEADALTLFPSLDPTAHDAAGGALGINILGDNLNRQLVLEVAGLHRTKTLTGALAQSDQVGVGARFQLPLTNAAILRLDGMFGHVAESKNISGVRFELRYKF